MRSLSSLPALMLVVLFYLRNLPVETVKIAPSFVRNMLENGGDRAIVAGIIALAGAFDRHTVAEGVETAAHIQTLLAMGCTIGQGYGIARPMPADDFTAWYRTAPRGSVRDLTDPSRFADAMGLTSIGNCPITGRCCN